MFDIIELKKTPRLARRLIDAANIGALCVDQNIIDLSKNDEGLFEQLLANFSLSNQELLTTQFIFDRNGRAIILESSSQRAKNSVLAFLKTKQRFPILFVTNLLTHNKWISNTLNLWPDLSVNVFGAFTDSAKDEVKLELIDRNSNVCFSALPELGFDVYVTRPATLYSGDLLKKTRLEQVIINDASDGGITRKARINLEHVCTETESVVILVNIERYKKGGTTVETFRDIDWSEKTGAFTSAQTLFPYIMLSEYFYGEYSSNEDELIRNGISTEKHKWLPLLNICPYLVE